MILHFRVLHPHLEDNWLEASAGCNNKCFHTTYDSNDTVDTIDDSDLGIEDGADCHTANLSCPVLYIILQMMYAMLLMPVICSLCCL